MGKWEIKGNPILRGFFKTKCNIQQDEENRTPITCTTKKTDGINKCIQWKHTSKLDKLVCFNDSIH